MSIVRSHSPWSSIRHAFVISQWVFIIVGLLACFRQQELSWLEHPFQPILKGPTIFGVIPSRLMVLRVFDRIKRLGLREYLKFCVKLRGIDFFFGQKSLQSLSVGSPMGGTFNKMIYRMHFLRTTSVFIHILVVVFPVITNLCRHFLGRLFLSQHAYILLELGNKLGRVGFIFMLNINGLRIA